MSNQHGGARKGAGRKPGNRLEAQQRARIASFTLSPSILERLAAHAEAQGKSKSWVVELALEAYLKPKS